MRVPRHADAAPRRSLAKAERSGKPVQYVVKRGDTLHAIAGRFKVALGELRRWNRLDDRQSRIYAGQSLVLYVDEPLST